MDRTPPTLLLIFLLGCGSPAGPAVPTVPAEPLDAGATDVAVVARDTGPAPVDAGSEVRAIGTLSEVGACPTPAGYRCAIYEVLCPDVAPARVAVRRSTASSTRGVIVFGSGNRGSTFWGGGQPESDPVPWRVLEELQAAGYVTVERAWEDRSGGWFADADGAGMAGAACRYATLLSAIADATPRTVPVCALGSSAGSMELSYALTAFGLDARVRFALFSGGPIARLDHACTGDWDCEAATASYPATACETVSCDVADLAQALDVVHDGACADGDEARLFDDSLAAMPNERLAMSTATSFQWGDGDCLGIAQSGRVVADLFEDAGVEVTRRVILNAGHSVQRSAAGGDNIVAEMLRGCQ